MPLYCGKPVEQKRDPVSGSIPYNPIKSANAGSLEPSIGVAACVIESVKNGDWVFKRITQRLLPPHLSSRPPRRLPPLS